MRRLLVDPASGGPLEWDAAGAHTADGRRSAVLNEGVAEFVTGDGSDHFDVQWNRFATIQLDAVNGTGQSRERLLAQSGLAPADFEGRTVLEVGCGAGRFTDVLLEFGAEVLALDYTSAVHVNRRRNIRAEAEGRALFARADVLSLPVAPQEFDIVMCYGVVQHTSDPDRALTALWRAVKPGGLLLVDRYSVSLRNLQPLKYGLRPLTRRLPTRLLLHAVELWVAGVFAAQARLFAALAGSGARRMLRLLAIRLVPNSVFPINLMLAGELDRESAREWTVLDTFDMYGPRYDRPQTFGRWRRSVGQLEGAEVVACRLCGQGNNAVLRRRP